MMKRAETKGRMVEVDPNKAHVCDWLRHPDIYPFDQGHIESLTHSIRTHGFLGGIKGRPIEGQPGEVEICCGHQRLLACREAGLVKIPIFVAQMDDDEMIALMARENALKAPNAISDSVQVAVHAATERLASIMLSGANANLSTIVLTFPKVAKAFENQRSLDTARGKLKSGQGCGEVILQRYLGEGDPDKCKYSLRDLKDAIAGLKLGGELTNILNGLAEASKQKQEEAETESEQMEAAADVAAISGAADACPSASYDSRCDELFETKPQRIAFRDSVTGIVMRELLAVENQFGFGRDMMDVLTRIVGDRAAVQPTSITKWIRDHAFDARAKTPADIERAKENERIDNALEKVGSIRNSIIKKLKTMVKQFMEVRDIIKENPECENQEPIWDLAQTIYYHIAACQDFLKVLNQPEDLENKDWRDLRHKEGIYAKEVIDAEEGEYQDITPETTRLIGGR